VRIIRYSVTKENKKGMLRKKNQYSIFKEPRQAQKSLCFFISQIRVNHPLGLIISLKRSGEPGWQRESRPTEG
jgi:hypothetical protein